MSLKVITLNSTQRKPYYRGSQLMWNVCVMRGFQWQQPVRNGHRRHIIRQLLGDPIPPHGTISTVWENSLYSHQMCMCWEHIYSQSNLIGFAGDTICNNYATLWF